MQNASHCSRRGVPNRRTVPQENNGYAGSASLVTLLSVIGPSYNKLCKFFSYHVYVLSVTVALLKKERKLGREETKGKDWSYKVWVENL